MFINVIVVTNNLFDTHKNKKIIIIINFTLLLLKIKIIKCKKIS